MKGKGAAIAAALIGSLVLLWWMLRSDDEGGEAPDVPTPGLRYDVAKMKALPNYHPAGDSKIKFANHAEFVRTLDQELIKRFPRKGARSILIAHAATGGGWHLASRPKTPSLIQHNWWGQTCSSQMIDDGVTFTIMSPRLASGAGKPQAFRAFSSAYESLMEGYIPNIHSYIDRFNVRDPVQYLDERADTLSLEEIAEYVKRINKWFAKKEQTPIGQAIRAGKWFWIYNKFCKGKLL